MHQIYTLKKATPLKLLMNPSPEPGVGRQKGCEVYPTTALAMDRLDIDKATQQMLLQKQNPIFILNKEQEELLKDLRDYQKEDALFLAARKNAACFNEQRTGKTPTSLLSFKLKGLKKILIVAPSSMLLPWAEEFERWYGLPCTAMIGTIKQRQKILDDWEYGLVVGYECLRLVDHYDKKTKEYSHTSGDLHKVLKHKDIEGLIVDEIHRIRNPKTLTAQAAFKLSKIPNKLALTGTPATGGQQEIYSVLHFLYPHTFTSYWGFIDYYFTRVLEQFWNGQRTITREKEGPLRRPKELQQYLNVISTQRKRKEVMPWLPDKNYLVVRLALTKPQTKYLKELREFYETEHIVTQGVLDRLIRYRQICLTPTLLDLAGASPKLNWIQQYIKDYPNRSIIIFSKFTTWLDILQDNLKGSEIISGNVSKKDRDLLKNKFQNGKIKILLIQIDAGKEGLTLDKGETIIFTDKFPPAGDIEQAEDRFVATTKEKANKEHLIISLVMKDSYEEHIEKALKIKATEIDVINDYKKYLLKGGEK